MNRLKWRQTRVQNMVLKLLCQHNVHWRCVEVNRVPIVDTWQVTIEVGLPMYPEPHRKLQDMARRWKFTLRVWTAEDGPAVLEG